VVVTRPTDLVGDRHRLTQARLGPLEVAGTRQGVAEGGVRGRQALAQLVALERLQRAGRVLQRHAMVVAVEGRRGQGEAHVGGLGRVGVPETRQRGPQVSHGGVGVTMPPADLPKRAGQRRQEVSGRVRVDGGAGGRPVQLGQGALGQTPCVFHTVQRPFDLRALHPRRRARGGQHVVSVGRRRRLLGPCPSAKVIPLGPDDGRHLGPRRASDVAHGPVHRRVSCFVEGSHGFGQPATLMKHASVQQEQVGAGA
jgi:hypothetical protein